MAASAVRRGAFVPARWPAAIGKPRLRAQRAFPSMMIATARATSGSSGSGAGRTFRSVRIFVKRLMPFLFFGLPSEAKVLAQPAENAEHFPRLDLHDLSFFLPEEVVDRLRVIVRQLLHVLLSAPFVVGAHVFELFQVMHRISTNVSHRDLPLLRDLAHDLDELL